METSQELNDYINHIKKSIKYYKRYQRSKKLINGPKDYWIIQLISFKEHLRMGKIKLKQLDKK